MTENIKIIGLCGRSGSGKGVVCQAFFERGVPFVDTDKVYRDLLEKEDSECLKSLTLEFGDGILDEKGMLDRRVLASIVFSDKERLCRLNEITHKYILEETRVLVESCAREGKRSVIIDAPVLFESGFCDICDLIFCVTAPEEVCVQRICERDGLSADRARARLANQLSVSELRKLCDDEIVNNGESDLECQVSNLIKKYGLGGENEK